MFTFKYLLTYSSLIICTHFYIDPVKINLHVSGWSSNMNYRTSANKERGFHSKNVFFSTLHNGTFCKFLCIFTMSICTNFSKTYLLSPIFWGAATIQGCPLLAQVQYQPLTVGMKHWSVKQKRRWPGLGVLIITDLLFLQ